MAGRGFFRLGLGISAVAGASVLGLPAMVNPAAASAADTALILGGTGLPTPGQGYVNIVGQNYLTPLGYGSYTPQVLTTPEQAYPITGVNSPTADTSLAQGVTILTNAVNQQIAAGNHVVVFGYSQGGAVAAQTAANLAASSNPPSASRLSFVLVGPPTNPNGGLTTRFEVPGATLSLGGLGETFNVTPVPSGPYPTSVYIQEYDGFADFPQYPLNFVSDLNALVGIFTQHFGYVGGLTSQQINSAVQLPTTGGTTQYYMIPTPNLPLLDPVRLLPLIGNPLADLIQPDLSVIVNLGYGSITNGWSPGPANVLTPIGLLPTNINLGDLVTALANGIPTGITNALNDLKSPQLFDFSSLSTLLGGLNGVGLTPSATPTLLQLLNGFATLGNGGTPVSSSGLGQTLLNDVAVVVPIAQTVGAIVSSLPQYDAQLFTSQLQSGNLLNAIGLPIAADVALAPYSLLVGGLLPVVGAVAATVTQVAQSVGLAPNPPAAATPAANAPVSTPAVTTPAASTVNTSVQPATASINTATTNTPKTTAGPLSTVGSVIKTALTPPAPAAVPTSQPVKVTPTTPVKVTPTSSPSTPGGTGHLGTPSPAAAHTPQSVSAVGTGATGSTHSTAATGLHHAHG